MLAQLIMELDGDPVHYMMSSNLQGVIYENIDSVYVDELHANRLHPYSQCLLRENEKCFWVIKTFTKNSFEKIILPLQNSRFKNFSIKNGTCHCDVRKKTLITENRDDLYREFCEEAGRKYITLEFLTPTSFRQNNHNIIFPDLRLIYQSLMNKYSSSSDSIEMFDQETLDQITEQSEIVNYNLKSVYFPMEGIKIPGFKGKITIKFGGSETMSKYVKMLVRFGEYSGVGIKTAMGMGAIRIVERGK